MMMMIIIIIIIIIIIKDKFSLPYCVVVLSAGVGRTGVFIALSIVLERMRYEGVVDLFQTVKLLRTQRQGMIQSEARALHVSV